MAQSLASGVTLRLYGEIGWEVMASEVADAIQGANGKDVSVHIFSYGGSAGEGLAIYNILSSYPGTVTTVIDGIGASAGGIIFMAGKNRVMPENALFHLHSTWGSASGDAEKMRNLADQFDAHSQSYRDIYAKKSGQESEKIDEWMTAGGGSGTWFSAADALAAGFATEVSAAEEVKALVPPPPGDRFPNAPAALAAWSGTSAMITKDLNFPQAQQMPPVSATAAEAAPITPQDPAPVQPQAQSAAPVQAAVVTQPIEDAEKVALRRENEIRRCAAQASLPPEKVDELIAGGKPFAEVALEIVRAHAATVENRSQAGHPARIGVIRDEGDTMAQAFGDELARRAGLIAKPTEVGRQVFGFSAKELCRAWLGRNGVNTAGRGINELISMAFHSTSDLTALFENTANRSLRSGYEEEAQTYLPLSTRQDLPDFRQATEVEFSARLIPQQLTEGGAYKTGVLKDGKGSWRIFTYGLEVGITREAIINDDLSALGEVPMHLGRGCRLLESNLSWSLITKESLGDTVIMDNKALFHADHANTISGATSTVGITGMDLAKTKLRKQKDSSGNSLNLPPSYLLAPPELETISLQFLFPTGYAPANLTGANGPNPFAQGVQLIIENRLADVANGAKMWYLTSNPARVPMLRHGYLDGQNGPMITQEEKRNPDVLSMLVRHDYGVALRDWRGFVRSAGE
jgi:ATP-dependent protease ClpP protease subunit